MPLKLLNSDIGIYNITFDILAKSYYCCGSLFFLLFCYYTIIIIIDLKYNVIGCYYIIGAYSLRYRGASDSTGAGNFYLLI